MATGCWGGGVVGLRATSQGQSDTEAASLCGVLGVGGVFPDHLRGSCEVSPAVEGSVPLQSGPPPLPEAYLEEGMPVSAGCSLLSRSRYPWVLQRGHDWAAPAPTRARLTARCAGGCALADHRPRAFRSTPCPSVT